MTVVVMTGGTSGLGAHAVRRLRATPGTLLVLGARRGPGSDALDLTELASVRAFAARVLDRVGDDPIDALVLNAGVIRPDAEGRTVDGVETTFAVNHLAHHLLLRLLLPALADGAAVVLTTSGTHDPATRAGLAPPRHADATLLAHPERDPGAADPRSRAAGQHAYTASKLCAVLTARYLALAAADGAARALRPVAVCPGQVFGTMLVRDLGVPRRVGWAVLGSPAGAPLRRLRPTLATAREAGATLADLATGRVSPPPGRSYAALRRGRLTWPEPSPLARSDAAARALWRDSGLLVGVPGDEPRRVADVTGPDLGTTGAALPEPPDQQRGPVPSV